MIIIIIDASLRKYHLHVVVGQAEANFKYLI